jgi:uncharacterized protein (UPF0332 family)
MRCGKPIVALEVGRVKAVGARWSHAKVQSTFASKLTRQRKVYPHSLAKMLADGLDIRHTADYKAVDISKRRANNILRWARDFVGRVEKEVT